MQIKFILLLLSAIIALSAQTKDSIANTTITDYPTKESIELSPKMKEQLKGIAEYLKQNPKQKVEIIGYTDNRGTPAEIENASLKRAENAMKYLVSLGIAKSRIAWKGEGARNPKATNDSEEGRAQNRRIEINIIK